MYVRAYVHAIFAVSRSAARALQMHSALQNAGSQRTHASPLCPMPIGRTGQGGGIPAEDCQRQLADRNMCGYCRGYWTLCPGEVTLRFHTSISLGLSTSAHQALSGKCDSNKLPASLPELAPATLAAVGLLRLLRPAVLTAGALAGTQCSKASHRPFAMVAIGLCVAVLGASSVLDRFVVAVEQLRRHVLSAVPACLAEAEKTVLATRGGVQMMVERSSLVHGDVVHLKEGRVPADCRVLQSFGLRIDDSFLPHRGVKVSELCVSGLGLWASSDRHRGHAVTSRAEEEDSSVLSANCVALATSRVASGTATAVVTRTGESTAVCLLLARLSSFSLFEVLCLPWM